MKSLEDLKNQFKALARKNHPDAGGNAETMKAINCEYDALFPIWRDRHNTAAKTEAEKTTETADSTRRRFYTEWGWEGSRYNSSMSTTEISKAIKIDRFTVCGLMVIFDFYQDRDAPAKLSAFERYMGRKRAYNCECYKSGAGWWIRVLTAADAPKLEEHEKRVSDAVEAFWQADHARRQAMQEAS